jgi:hypothetical protein
MILVLGAERLYSELGARYPGSGSGSIRVLKLPKSGGVRSFADSRPLALLCDALIKAADSHIFSIFTLFFFA